MSSQQQAQTSSSLRKARCRVGPDGVHYFDRVTGLNLLIDEVNPPPADWSAAPRNISVALTDRCDLRCPHCYAPKTEAKLDFGVLTSWLRELDRAGALGVGFGGGEPTLWPRFADLCAFVTSETGLAVSLTTHGHHLQPDLIARLKGHVHFLRISVDGVGATYERHRGRAFVDLLAALERARELSPFGLNVVVNTQTIHELDDLEQLATRVGARELLLLPQQRTQSAGGIDVATADRLRAWVGERRAGVRLATSEAGAEGMPTCEPLPLERGLRAYAHINARGLLKSNSFSERGVEIEAAGGILQALEKLRPQEERE